MAPDASDHVPPTRRRALRLLGGAAVGAAAAVVTAGSAGATPDDDPFLTLGVTSNEANFETGLQVTSTVNVGIGLGVTDNGLGALPSAISGGGAVFGHTRGTAFATAVLGYAEGNQTAVQAHAPNGTGLVALGSTYGARSTGAAFGIQASGGAAGVEGIGTSTGVGVYAWGGQGAIKVGRDSPVALPAPPARTGVSFDTDVLDSDSNGGLWWCVAGGTPGQWRQVSGPDVAGAFHVVTPTRIFDSRAAQPARGAIAAGSSRTVPVADGRDLNGAVIVSDLVPAGATAITCNVTVVGTGPAGFITLNPGGVTTIGAASATWSAPGQTTTTGTVAALSTTRTLTILCGGAGAFTDVVVDITGYYR